MANLSMRRCAKGLLGAILLALVVPALAAEQPPASPDSTLEFVEVKIDGGPLFKVRGATSLPAQVRAASIESRIQALADDASVDPASVRQQPEGDFIQIWGGKTRIMVVTQPDAQAEQLPADLLASLIQDRIRKAIIDYREARSSQNRIRGAVEAAGGTLLAAAMAALLLWLSLRLQRRIEAVMRSRVQTVGIQSFEILRAERMRTVVLGSIRLLSVAALGSLAVFWLIFTLRRFPMTRGVAETLLGDILTPLTALGRGFVGALPNLFFLAILYFVVRGALRLIRAFFVAVEHGGVSLSDFEPEWAMPTYKLVRLTVVALGLVIAYPYIPGSGSDAFKGVSLFVGVVFSLGSSSAIANIIAGYMMTYRRAFRVGDRVKIGDVVGDVTSVRLQVTHLRTPKNEEVVIPNSQIINGHVLNYSTLAAESGLLLHTTVGIGYETPWRQVEAMLLEAARRTPGLAAKPEPFVLQTALGDFAITYEINVGCDEPQRMAQMYTVLHRNILDVFNEYGVAIMTPAYVSDPPDAKLVPKSKWFQQPAKPDRD
jgi:small-conductance mechanosensitive channel